MLTSRDMLKLGVTSLNNGVWEGQRILSKSWVRKSAAPYSSWFNTFLQPIPPGENAWGRSGYAYTWWTHEFSKGLKAIPSYFALGWGGQKIFILPEQDAVMVFTGANYTSADLTTRILSKFVIPAFQ